MASTARTIVRVLVPRPLRLLLRRNWRRAQRHRRRVKAGRRSLTRRFEIRLPDRPATTRTPASPDVAVRSRLRIEAPSRLSIPARLERRGLADFEPEGIACVLALLERSAPGAFFDVGANIAPYSLVASALTEWTIVAFEPAPALAAAARRIRDRNGLSFAIEQLALGEQPGMLPLYLSTKSDTSNSLRATFRPWERTVTVQVDTLDGYCRRTGLWPSVLKIDTETTEPAVLRGGGRLLEERRPWIVCEVLQGHTEAALEEIIEPLGYRRYHIRGGAVLEERDRLAGETTMNLDWLLAPDAVEEELASRARAWAEALQRCGPIAAETR